MGGPRRSPAVLRNHTRPGRVGRCALAVLLAAATVGWIGEGSTSAAGPAELISVDPDGGGPLATQDNAASVSGDGNVVAFTGNPPVGSEFVSDWVYVRDRSAGVTTAVPTPFNVSAMNGAVVSRDGCHVAFWGFYPQITFPPPFVFIIPAQWDIYSWDRCTPDTLPIAVSEVPPATRSPRTQPPATREGPWRSRQTGDTSPTLHSRRQAASGSPESTRAARSSKRSSPTASSTPTRSTCPMTARTWRSVARRPSMTSPATSSSDGPRHASPERRWCATLG